MRTVALGEVVTFTNGGTPSRANSEFWAGDIPWVSGADFLPSGELARRRHVTLAAISSSAASLAQIGDLLLVIRTGVGKCHAVTSPVSFSQDIVAITPNDDLDVQYLRHFVQSQTQWLVRQARGATIKGVTRQVVSELRIPLPPLHEQRRIAAILDRSDSLGAIGQKAIERSATTVESLFHRMFGGLREMATVEYVAATHKGAIRTGPFGSQLLHSEFTADGVAVLGIDNVVTNDFAWRARRFISPEKYATLSRYKVEAGDVLITIMGTCGRCAVVPDNIPTAINTKHLCAITVDRSVVLPEFLRACFLWHPESRRHLTSQTKGALMDGLNMGIIKGMPIPLPSISNQADFVAQASGAQAQTQGLRERSDQLTVLKAALRSRAFCGQL